MSTSNELLLEAKGITKYFGTITALENVNLKVHAVTEGTDAQATVSVKIEENDRTTVGQSADTDTLVASANAYLNALNKMIIKREKKAPSQNIKHQKVRGI